MRALASEAARTVRRGLREARRRGGHPARTRQHVAPARPEQRTDPAAPDVELVASDAELDALRGALVRELDGLALRDRDDCSGSFRRV